MKVSEIREMTNEDLKIRESELTEQIFRGCFKKSLGEVDAVKLIRSQKKELARIKTIAHERALKIQR